MGETVRPPGEGGPGGEALGRSRGGFTTKIHLSADGRCRVLSLLLTAGQRADCTQFEPVMERIRVPRLGPGRPRLHHRDEVSLTAMGWEAPLEPAPLTTASVDALPANHPDVDWELLHAVEKGRHSPSRLTAPDPGPSRVRCRRLDALWFRSGSAGERRITDEALAFGRMGA